MFGLPDPVTVLITGVVGIILRVSILAFMLPGIGDTAIPMRVRLGAVLAITAVIVPVTLPAQLPRVAQTDIFVLMAFEAIIGFALGFAFRVLIYALTIAGNIIAMSASLSQLFGAGVQAEPNPSISMLLTAAGTALFVTLDLHTHAIGLLAESYELFPLGDMPRTDTLAQWATERTVRAFNLAVSLALPFILIGFLYNVVLGLMNQAMPQMMVTFVGVPANVLAALLLLAISVGLILSVWLDVVPEAFRGFW